MVDLTSTVMKWTRGNEHLHTIEETIEAYGQSQPCVVVSYVDPNTGEKSWGVEGAPKPPPLSLNLLIGEALYNYRSALDHLAWQLVLQAGQVPDNSTSFVIKDRPHDFSSAVGRNLKGMTPAMVNAIKAEQPCYGRNPYTNHILSTFESLSNIDKHRHFNLTVSAIDGGFFSQSLPVRASSQFFIHRGAIEDGTPLARVPRENVNVDFSPIIGITFGKTGPTTREILYGINLIVAQIIEHFASEFFSIPLYLPRS